jgi:hypothetical protein
MVNPGVQEGGLDKILAWSSYNLNGSDAQIENLTLMGSREYDAVGNGLDNEIVGNTSHNLLQGLAGRDSISGGDGNDTLEGGLGGDVLRGGAGRDVFRISSRDDSRLGAGSLDQILDYNLFDDSIEFVGMEGVGLASANFYVLPIEYTITLIVENQAYLNKKVVFLASDVLGSVDIYMYVNGAGTGTNYDGSLLRYSVSQSGVASDGYLSNALVWIDTDNDGVRDWTDGNGNGSFDSGEGESWTLTDGQGRTVDFTNVVLIMTSNLPGEPIDYFRPEFVNRIDEIVRFRSLTEEDLSHIVEIQLEHLVTRMADRRILLQVTPAARIMLGAKGFDASFGARPLKRLIQREIADKAAIIILEGGVAEDGIIRVDVLNDELNVAAVSQ